MSATVVPARHDHESGNAVHTVLARIARSLDPKDPAQMDVLRSAAEAAHTLHASGEDSPLRARARVLLERLHAAATDEPCPL